MQKKKKKKARKEQKFFLTSRKEKVKLMTLTMALFPESSFVEYPVPKEMQTLLVLAFTPVLLIYRMDFSEIWNMVNANKC